jgi:large subunit ribosomal protein L22
MEARAVGRGIRVSTRKVRLVVDVVRGRRVSEALALLQFMPRAGASEVAAIIKSAVANAENNYQMTPDALVIKSINANEGQRSKRFLPRSRGRVSPVLKRSSHVTVVLEEKED